MENTITRAVVLTALLFSGVSQAAQFITHDTYPTGTAPQAVTSADFNADGAVDIAVGNLSSGDISLYFNRNDGSGRFEPPVQRTFELKGSQVNNILATDLNNDTKPDLVVVREHYLSILMNGGTGTFWPADNYVVPSSNQHSLVATDLNGDGALDLVLSTGEGTSTGRVDIFLNTNNPTSGNCACGGGLEQGYYKEIPYLDYADVADFNGDGAPDVVIGASNTGRVGILWNVYNSGGELTTPAWYADLGPVAIRSIAAGDINGDGLADVIAGTSNSVSVMSNTGVIDAPLGSPASIGEAAGETGLADLDGDGALDIHAIQYGLTVYNNRNEATAEFRTPPSHYSLVGATRATVADFDGDGSPDVAVTSMAEDSLFVIKNEGDGSGRLKSGISVPSVRPYEVVSGDFNGDGVPDLATASISNGDFGVHFGLGDGTARFDSPMLYSDPNCSGRSMAAADFNSTGRPDIIGTVGADSIALCLNQGGGNFGAPITYAAGTYTTSLAVGDFNKDGRPDVVVSNGSSNDVTVHWNNGAGFDEAVHYTTGTFPYAVTVADLNQDGFADFAVTNRDDASVSVFLNHLGAGFAKSADYQVGLTPISLQAGDINSDGAPDLVTANAGGDGVSILLNANDLTGRFSPAVNSPAGPTPYSVALGDINGDNALDVLVTNGHSQPTVSLLLNRNDGSAELSPAVEYPVGYNSRAAAMGDFNGDGALDVAVANYDSLFLTVLLNSNDTTPDPFAFVDQIDVALDTAVTSNAITVRGLTYGTPISITGGKYSINDGHFTDAPGTIVDGDEVRIQITSANSYATRASAELSVGDVTGGFSVTTKYDTVPDAFGFTDLTDAARDTVIASEPITVTGLGASTPISISAGEYALNGGAFTSVAGFVESGNTLSVRVRTSSEYATAVSATVDIGGVTGTFSVTTLKDAVPDSFGFAGVTDAARGILVTSEPVTITGLGTASPISITGGEYALNGEAFTSQADIVEPGDTLRVRATSSPDYSTEVVATLDIGGISGTFSVTTIADTVPDAFTFADVSGVSLGLTIISDPVTVIGLGAPSPIIITGGEYAVNEGLFTAEPGLVHSGDRIRVRVTSASDYATDVAATVDIGGVSDTFSVTTLEDTIPDAFTFTDVAGVARGVVVTSDPITLTGFHAPSPINIDGGEYSVNGGSFTAQAGSVSPGDSISVKVTSATEYAGEVRATVDIGGVADTFSVVTRPDTIPDHFDFLDQDNVGPGNLVMSNAVTIGGLGAPAPITCNACEYSINDSEFTSAGGTVVAGDEIRIRVVSASDYDTNTTAVVTIGGVSDSITVTTIPDLVPDRFSLSFPDSEENTPGATIVFAPIAVSGLGAPAPISISGGEYSVNGSAFTVAPGIVHNGDTVEVRVKCADTPGTTVEATLTVGEASETVVVQTEAPANSRPGAGGSGGGGGALGMAFMLALGGISIYRKKATDEKK